MIAVRGGEPLDLSIEDLSGLAGARLSLMDGFSQEIKGVGEIPADRPGSDRMFRHAAERSLAACGEYVHQVARLDRS